MSVNRKAIRVPTVRPKGTVFAGLAAIGALGVGTLAVGLSSAATPFAAKTVNVPANQEWTDTGIALTVGKKVTITASGMIQWGSGSPTVGPLGKTFSQNSCGEQTYKHQTEPPPFLAPGRNCYSMLFRIGTSGVPFQTGTKIAFVSPVAGELFLGVNDNYFPDNSGSWTAKISTS
jgi:hypothetical protein